MPNVRLGHCVVHVSDWPRSIASYRDVLGAEPVGTGAGWSYRFGAQQLNAHGPGVDAAPVARVPVPPGGSELCFEWPGPTSDAERHPRRLGVEVQMDPVERRGDGGVGKR